MCDNNIPEHLATVPASNEMDSVWVNVTKKEGYLPAIVKGLDVDVVSGDPKTVSHGVTSVADRGGNIGAPGGLPPNYVMYGA